MSFLNPVSEPVKRFSSTDAGAPQINYSARVAGDIKAVLKACLVTGYGSKEGAGWSIVNEVNHVAEFVSPSAAMSDYRFGIDDTSTSSTTWYYQYQDSRVNPSYNAPVKAFTGIELNNANNGWQLLVTSRGIVFLETTYQTRILDTTCRITYLGAVKSGLIETTKNICFYNIGYSGAISDHYSFFNGTYLHANLSNLNSFSLISISPFANGSYTYQVLNGISALDIVSGVYMRSGAVMVGLLPALLSKVVNGTSQLYGTSDQTINDRPYLKVTSGYKGGSLSEMEERVRVFLIPLDYWEY